ncbi:MAG: hypothetical protein ABEI32_15175 [Halothece sp.]
MNQPNSQTDWEKRLQELEAEVNEETNQQKTSAEQSYVADSSPLNSNSNQFSNQVQNISSQVRRWFNELPIVGKVIVVAVGIGISFSLLKTVFQLITSLLTLAIIGALGYVGYQVLIKSKNSNND